MKASEPRFATALGRDYIAGDEGGEKRWVENPRDGREQRPNSSAKGNGPMFSHEAVIYVGDDLLSHTLSRAVQSALRGLTSVFGMGTGISPAVKSPASLTWTR